MKDFFDAEDMNCPLPASDGEFITLAHGSGGRLSQQLVKDLFANAFANDILNKLNDQAELRLNGNRLSFSTDTFVVDPLFFPGGNIGELAINGTVNDICMNGARPLWLSCGFILEEGFAIADLRRIVQSMRAAADEAGVKIVTGDTKVVNKGKGDKLFINTSGIGVIEHAFDISPASVQPGDHILINGTVGDHGMAILSKREGLSFESDLRSDTAALNGLVAELLAEAGPALHAMRDATRGGVAAVLNEISQSRGLRMEIEQDVVPVSQAVNGACEMLGLDPLYVANEGKMVIFVDGARADYVLEKMRSHPLGHYAEKIGVVGESSGPVTIRTAFGTRRILDMPLAEQLPRIC